MRSKSPILLLLAALAVAGGCAAAAREDGPSPAFSVTIPLDRDRPGTESVGALRFRGALELTDGAGAGGLSGLWISPDGARFLAVSDLGKTVTGRLSYDRDGRLTGAGNYAVARLPLDPNVDGFRGRRNDSEEVARLPGGGWLVSLERDHRILRYADDAERPNGTPVRLPTPPGLEDAPANGGIESLAAFTDGRLLAIEEGDDDGVQERPAWIAPAMPKTPADWKPLTYRTAPRFRPAGAAPLPDGGLLVLERRFTVLGGWGSRIVYVPPGALRPGATVEGMELARLEPPLLNDNFEGIAVRPGQGGETLVYIVSDDNRSPLQRTYLVLFALPEQALRPAVAGR